MLGPFLDGLWGPLDCWPQGEPLPLATMTSVGQRAVVLGLGLWSWVRYIHLAMILLTMILLNCQNPRKTLPRAVAVSFLDSVLPARIMTLSPVACCVTMALVRQRLAVLGLASHGGVGAILLLYYCCSVEFRNCHYTPGC